MKVKPEAVAKSGDFALGGPAGGDVRELLAGALEDGTAFLHELTRKALKRLGTNEKVLAASSLFTTSELREFADSISESLAMGDLLGRARIHSRMIQAGGNPSADPGAETPETFSDLFTFADPPEGGPIVPAPPPRGQVLSRSPDLFGRIEPLPPEGAIRFFESLVPSIAVQPDLFTAGIRQRAFTLAVSSEQALTERVKNIVLDSIKTGSGSRAGSIAIEETLISAGVTPLHSQYCELVYRTNALNAYNTGAADELQSPIISEFFPAWEYIGIHDGRDRPRHTMHFGKFFPPSITFAMVRDWEKGEFDGFNCRCTFRPVSKYEWAKLRAAGVDFATLSAE